MGDGAGKATVIPRQEFAFPRRKETRGAAERTDQTKVRFSVTGPVVSVGVHAKGNPCLTYADLRNVRNVSKTIASSTDETNANVLGSGTAPTIGVPPLKPLLLSAQVSETKFGVPVVVAGLFPANVTAVPAAVSVNALPQVICAPGSKAISVPAKIFPWNALLSPRVAWVPTSKYTPAAAAPVPVTTTDELLAVVNPAAIWKIQTGSGLLPPSRVSAPFKRVADKVEV